VIFTNEPPTAVTNNLTDLSGTNAVRFYRLQVETNR
jgi:hypothetical protein